MVVLLPPAWDDLVDPLLMAAAGRGDRLVVLDVLAPEMLLSGRREWPGLTVEDRWAARRDALREVVRGCGPVPRCVVAVEVHCGPPVDSDPGVAQAARPVRAADGYSSPVRNWARPCPKDQSSLAFSVTDTMRSVGRTRPSSSRRCASAA